MQTFKLNNGITLPAAGFGTFLIEEGETARRAVTEALEIGYRHIDTAAAYGNEKGVGQGIRESGLPREEIFLTTKLWNEDVRQGRAKEAFARSMDLLGLDYLDLYLIHWPANGFVEAWLAMEELYKEGRIRAIGISNFQKHHIDTLMEKATITPALNQIECHPHLTQVELRAYCAEKSILCEAWSPLGGKGGKLLDDAAIGKIAAKHGRQPAQIILRWAYQAGLSSLAKSTHAERIRQNLAIFDFALDDGDMAAIDGMNRDKRFGADPDNFSF